NKLSDEETMGVIAATGRVIEHYHHPIYTIIYDMEGKPSEFSFMPLSQYEGLEQKSYPDLNTLLDEYYSEKDKAERLRQKGKDLHKLVQNLIERTIRKQAARHEEMAVGVDNEKYRIYGELLTANLFKLEKGMKSVELLNYYDGTLITIPLEPKIGGNQNAQKYYKEYKKKQTAVKMLTTLIKQGEIELEYLKSIAYAIDEAQGEGELMAIRSELHSAGYLKYYKNREKKQKSQDFIKYTSSDGFLILVGRNNLQN
ncbi:MAG: NFACT family protein, partial [Oscillospiraceae bacterium]